MVDPTFSLIEIFLQRLGQRFDHPASFYLFGGSAVLLLGGARKTGDVDFTFTVDADKADLLRGVIQTLATEMNLDLEESVPSEFMPLPAGTESRHRLIGRYGQIGAYIFDPYSLALMKVDRAFPSDFEDVFFLLRNGHIEMKTLEEKMREVAPRHDEGLFLQRNFAELVKEWKASGNG